MSRTVIGKIVGRLALPDTRRFVKGERTRQANPPDSIEITPLPLADDNLAATKEILERGCDCPKHRRDGKGRKKPGRLALRPNETPHKAKERQYQGKDNHTAHIALRPIDDAHDAAIVIPNDRNLRLRFCGSRGGPLRLNPK